ncbi:MAG: hypothetical protein PWQ67_1291 [Clostridia bacterium]|jgi:serine/threonine protein kinase|nr:hypothetical protein [Clostridia bacterium]MDN5322837.1 hypothetical protein [Clostridia bacterium]
MNLNLQPGQNIYKYLLKRKLGNGQFGQVWLSTDTSINKEVALKILDDPYETVANLLEEARIENKLNHQNLLKICYADVVKVEEKLITLISQEYHPNGYLVNRLNNFNFLPLPEVIKYLCDILCGLEYLHHQGFFHNDIKPSNILIGNNSEGILADYGITGFSPDGGSITPKSSYIIHQAPETSMEKPIINIATDIYQVGVTAF